MSVVSREPVQIFGKCSFMIEDLGNLEIFLSPSTWVIPQGQIWLWKFQVYAWILGSMENNFPFKTQKKVAEHFGIFWFP